MDGAPEVTSAIANSHEQAEIIGKKIEVTPDQLGKAATPDGKSLFGNRLPFLNDMLSGLDRAAVALGLRSTPESQARAQAEKAQRDEAIRQMTINKIKSEGVLPPGEHTNHGWQQDAIQQINWKMAEQVGLNPTELSKAEKYR